jgi:quercetin dioxygenase-like cupin family protein
MTSHVLRLITDRYGSGETLQLAGANRVLYVVEGSAIVRAGGAAAALDPNSAWCGPGAVSVAAGKAGARLLRFELVGTPAASALQACADSRITLAEPVALPAAEVLLRCDRVDFPPGGEALTHVHQGPGIRCLLAGAIRIDAAGQSHAYRPGEAWFEAGPDPVYAAASPEGPTAFARVMVLPRTCHGKSSIRYVRPEDADRPKTQKYQIFADEFITP